MNEKHESAYHGCMTFAGSFCGAVTVGERGQIVIPADARQQLSIHPGDKLLVMKHPAYRGLMVFSIDSAREFLDMFAEAISRLEEQSKEESE